MNLNIIQSRILHSQVLVVVYFFYSHLSLKKIMSIKIKCLSCAVRFFCNCVFQLLKKFISQLDFSGLCIKRATQGSIVLILVNKLDWWCVPVFPFTTLVELVRGHCHPVCCRLVTPTTASSLSQRSPVLRQPITRSHFFGQAASELPWQQAKNFLLFFFFLSSSPVSPSCYLYL